MIILKNIIFILLILILVSCTLSNEEIRQHEWKYGEGSRSGHDFIFFGGGVFKLTDDTIFFIDTAIATIVDTRKNYFLYDNEITLKNIKTGKIAIYNDFGKVKVQDTIVSIEITQSIDTIEPPAPPSPPLLPEKK